MAQPEETGPVRPLPERPERDIDQPVKAPKRTGKELASLVSSQWGERNADRGQVSDFKVTVPVHGTQDSIEFSKVEAVDNVIKVWTNGNVSDSPDYVIVNPPVLVQVSKTEAIEDPLGAVAQAIHGVKK